MKRFRFKLQALLSYREKLEEDAKMVLGEAVQLEATMKRELDSMDEERHEIAQQQGALLNMNVGGEQYMQFINYQQDLFRRIEQKIGDIQQQHTVVEAKRGLLIRATQNKKALEIIRDKKKAEFKKEQNVIETKFLDDISQRKRFLE
ncbi:MAG: flagellar export protein FliJ [Fibrobacterales bacterium]